MSCRNSKAGGRAVPGAEPGRGLPARVAERGAPQVREAELCVRGPGSSGSRPAVQPDAEGGRPDPCPAPEAGPGA